MGYGIDYPQPVWAEQPVERWTEAFEQAVRRLLRETGVSARQVRALGLASQVEGVVPIELLGGVRFPQIGELPYLLTLGGYGFYWIRLPAPEGGDSDDG